MRIESEESCHTILVLKKLIDYLLNFNSSLVSNLWNISKPFFINILTKEKTLYTESTRKNYDKEMIINTLFNRKKILFIYKRNVIQFAKHLEHQCFRLRLFSSRWSGGERIRLTDESSKHVLYGLLSFRNNSKITPE